MSSSNHYSAEAQRALTSGVVYLRAGRLLEADAAFRASLELQPSAEAYDGIGCVSFLKGEFDMAQEMFVKAHEINPSYARAVAHAAFVEEKRGSKHAAEMLFNQALWEDPADIQIRNNFAGFLAEELGTIEGAAHELRKANAINPNKIIEKNLERLSEGSKRSQS